MGNMLTGTVYCTLTKFRGNGFMYAHFCQKYLMKLTLETNVFLYDVC